MPPKVRTGSVISIAPCQSIDRALRQISLQGALIWTKLPQIITCGIGPEGLIQSNTTALPHTPEKITFPFGKCLELQSPLRRVRPSLYGGPLNAQALEPCRAAHSQPGRPGRCLGGRAAGRCGPTPRPSRRHRGRRRRQEGCAAIMRGLVPPRFLRVVKRRAP